MLWPNNWYTGLQVKQSAGFTFLNKALSLHLSPPWCIKRGNPIKDSTQGGAEIHIHKNCMCLYSWSLHTRETGNGLKSRKKAKSTAIPAP